jgi:hypothetical protein
MTSFELVTLFVRRFEFWYHQDTLAKSDKYVSGGLAKSPK